MSQGFVAHITEGRCNRLKNGFGSLGRTFVQTDGPLEGHVARDNHTLLEVLRKELQFLEGGGYDRVAAHYWKPVSVFQNSVSCPNVDDPNKSVPCHKCTYYELVPPHTRDESVPCHFIPLNDEGETIHSMERQYSQEELLEAVGVWLRTTIKKLEKESSN